MEKEKFEKSKKGLLGLFKFLASINLILGIFMLFLVASNHFSDFNAANTLDKYNMLKLLEGFIYLVIAGYAYLCVKMAKKDSKYAGINGIILGILYMVFHNIVYSNLIGIILGIIIIFDSIKYLVHYKEAK